MSGQEPSLRGMVVGLGVMGANHLRVLTAMPGVEVAVVVDPDPARRAGALEGGVAAAHAGLEEALAAERVDFAVLAVPVSVLPEAAHRAIASGVHVLVEKPTAPNERLAREMVAAARGKGVRFGVGHVERFNPAVLALRDKLSAGTIGEILQLHARRLSPFPNRASTQGVALDLSTHDIDVMRFLTGDEVSRVYAETAAPLSGDQEDLACATLRFDGGITGLLETNWVTPTKIRSLSVTGEHGMYILDYLTQDLFFHEHPTRPTDWDALAGIRGGGEGNMIRFALERREPLRVQWESFLEAVRTGAEPAVNGRDGVAALSVAQAIQRSGVQHAVIVPGYREARA